MFSRLEREEDFARQRRERRRRLWEFRMGVKEQQQN
jgi:hypothetical protein